MASSRPLRKSSRMSSPTDAATKDSLLSKGETSSANTDSWEEPPLRAPAPSFEDHKGLERTGVLEHMAPLGSLPNQKVRLRLKAHDTLRRNAPVRNGDLALSKDDLNVPDPTVPIVTRRSESRKLEDRSSKLISSRERDDDQDYLPKGFTKTTPVKANPPQPLIHGTPTSRTSAGQARLRQVVESAVERSNELGNPILGLAVKRLFDESLQNRTLADLLDAVLSQRPTARQATDFQGYIKVAKKQIKSETRSRRHSSHSMGINSKSVSMSPSKSTRQSVVRQTGISKDLSDMTGLDKSDNSSTSHQPSTQQESPNQQESSNQHIASTQQLTENMEGNGSLSRGERPARRRKVSRSASTSSSLSSLPSTEDRDFSPTFEPSPQDNSKDQQPTQPLQGLRLQTLSARKQTNSKKRPAPTIHINDDSAEELTAKRRKFQKTFDDYTITESEIRSTPLPRKQAQIPSFAASFNAGREQQTRLRNGTSQGSRMDDNDDIQSLGSSTQGELLIPPPAGARSTSRGVTPNLLGRSAKQLRKAARVKMSPMKGKTGVIAGIARPVRGGRDDSEEHENLSRDNSDICFTCGGNGRLLCCDGCSRSFHFTCLDPPITTVPEEAWYCIECIHKQHGPSQSNRGAFSSLLHDVDKKNSHAFYLPYEVRDFFKGVKTGEEGEFEECVAMKAKSRVGYEEPNTNNCKLKDAKDNTILCFSCGKSSLGNREIISCDSCGQNWHLDCLDPPLAVAPRKINNGKAKNFWRCPAHTDIALQNLGSISASRKRKASERYIKPREPKKPRLVTPAIARGFRNDGNIEVILSTTPSEKDQEADEATGVAYSIPEKAIRLDFIDRVKSLNEGLEQEREPRQEQRRPFKTRARDARRLREAASLKSRREANEREERERRDQAEREAALQRRLRETHPVDREAALLLADFAQQPPWPVDDEVTNLIDTLIAEAPPEVTDLGSNDATADAVGSSANDDSSSSPAPPESRFAREKAWYQILQMISQTRLEVIEMAEEEERREQEQGQANEQAQELGQEHEREASPPADESGEL